MPDHPSKHDARLSQSDQNGPGDDGIIVNIHNRTGQQLARRYRRINGTGFTELTVTGDPLPAFTRRILDPALYIIGGWLLFESIILIANHFFLKG